MKYWNHSLFAFVLLCFGAGFTGTAGAANFTQEAFDAARKAGKPVLIDVSPPWCPTCKAQAPIVNGIKSEPRFKELVVFEVDFDSQKDVLREFGVHQQSTLIVFKGTGEAGRSIGNTDKASIEALVAKAF